MLNELIWKWASPHSNSRSGIQTIKNIKEPRSKLRGISDRNGREVREIQNEIIKSYILDFAKHAPASNIPKLTLLGD